MDQENIYNRLINFDSGKPDSPDKSYDAVGLEPVTGKSIIESDYPLVPLAPFSDFSTGKDNKHDTAEYLGKYIGQCIRVQMLFECNCQWVERTGLLAEVGQGFIVIETCWHDYILCNMDSIKLITIYR